MKKVLFPLIALVLVLGLALPMAMPAGAHMEGCPFTTDLLAGQTEDVGDVSVWNDGTNLYVKYETTGGWEMTETHLHVATSLADIPQSAAKGPKKGQNGNPIPGQFDYQIEHDPAVTTYTYTIDLGDWEPCNNLCIAAHADVERTESGNFTPELDWQRSSEPATTNVSGYGASWTPTEAFTILLDPNQTVWDNGTYYNNSVPAGREWASWKYAYTDPDGGSYADSSDLRRFQASFSVPDGYAVTGGSLYAPHFTGGIPINDNVYIFVNGEDNLLFWGGTRVNQIPGGTFLNMSGTQALRGTIEPVETDRWYISGTIPNATSFVSGANFIDIFTEENERWGGMGKLVLELSYEQTFSETAWGNGDDFPGKNWATYFEYHVQFPMVLNGTGNYTAEWETDPAYVKSLPCSIHLATANFTGPSADEARIVISLPNGTTLGDIESISWWVYAVTGYPPHLDITLDVNDNGVVDNEDMLTAEMNLNCVGAPKSIAQLQTEIAYNTSWLQTFELILGDGFNAIDDATVFWVTKMGSGDLNAPSGTLAQWKAGVVGNDPENEMTTPVINGTAPVVKLEIEVDNWVVQSEVYADDIEINLGS